MHNKANNKGRAADGARASRFQVQRQRLAAADAQR